MKAELGGVYAVPASHGEGRFVASKEWLEKLAANGQIATQYVDLNGNPTMDEDFNPNASYWAIGSFSSEYALHNSLPFTISSKRSVKSGLVRCTFVSGDISFG